MPRTLTLSMAGGHRPVGNVEWCRVWPALEARAAVGAWRSRWDNRSHAHHQRAGETVQIGVIVALGSAVLFGLSTPLAKVLVGAVSPISLAGLLYAGSGLGLSLVLVGRYVWVPGKLQVSLPQRQEWLWLAAAIFFGGI